MSKPLSRHEQEEQDRQFAQRLHLEEVAAARAREQQQQQRQQHPQQQQQYQQQHHVPPQPGQQDPGQQVGHQHPHGYQAVPASDELQSGTAEYQPLLGGGISNEAVQGQMLDPAAVHAAQGANGRGSPQPMKRIECFQCKVVNDVGPNVTSFNCKQCGAGVTTTPPPAVDALLRCHICSTTNRVHIIPGSYFRCGNCQQNVKAPANIPRQITYQYVQQPVMYAPFGYGCYPGYYGGYYHRRPPYGYGLW